MEFVELRGESGKLLDGYGYYKDDFYYNFYEYGLINKKPQINANTIKLLYNTGNYSVGAFQLDCNFIGYNPDNNSAITPSNINKEENITIEIPSNKGLIDKK